jgi:D-amino-acid dehydrogenase
MLCKTQKGLDAEAAVAEQARAIGLAAEVVDAHQTAKLDPNIQMNVMGAVYFPEDCHLNPSRLLDQLRARIRAMGGKIEYGQEVLEWQSAAGRVRSVKTATGEFSADEFVIAGGSWSSSLLSRLGCKIPMQAGKGYSISLENPQELPQLCSIFTEAKVAITPMGNALRFAGTMEVGGLEHKVNEQRVHGILRSIPEYFPAFQVNDFRDCRPWVGLRPVSPDGIPYLGRVPHFSNLTAATGHAMMGVSLAPVTGKMVADLLIGTPTFRNLSAMKIDRFS